ncbi:MAG TPA: nucleoside recognition domain-containing protein [Fluviicola sp.]|nr:nucleoside recognition domain-containing protein [Fluviicola sp.]
MLLNRIWIGFFLVAIVTGLAKLLFWHDVNIFKTMVEGLFNSAKLGFELSIYMTGALCMCLGFMNVGEKGGAVRILSKAISPLFTKVFPEVPKDHPAVGAIMMNFSANMLGLDNAATPMGLKAMKELQELNPQKDTASNAQIMFLALNTAGMTIIPISVLSILSIQKSANPTEIFLPVLITTFCSALSALILVAIKQRIRLFHPTVIAYLGSAIAFLAALLVCLYHYPEYTQNIANIGGNVIILGIFVMFIVLAVIKKVNVYEEFVEGAKEGFQVAISIIPFLVTMLVGIGIFNSSGAMQAVMDGFEWFFLQIGLVHTEFVDALPVGIMKPFSGGSARALMIQTISEYGVNDLRSKIAATMQGGTETTFYVLAVYFGSVNIKNTRYAAGVGLLVDIIGVIIAILVSYLFYEVPPVK